MNNLQAKVVLSVGFGLRWQSKSNGRPVAKEAGVFMRTSPIAPMLLDPRAVQALQPDELDFTFKETRVAVLDMVLLHTSPAPTPVQSYQKKA